MKKVIFVCLLSLSVCLSVPTQAPETPATPDAKAAKETEPKLETPKPAVLEANNVTANKTAAANTTATAQSTAPVNATENATATKETQTTPKAVNETSTKTNDTKPTEKANTELKPTDVTEKPTEKKEETPKGTPTGSVVPVNKPTAETAETAAKNATVTPKADNVSPTVAPVEAKTRAFDGPSFIGGMILTLGLLAIGFMGFKYYKNQTERNYHTL
ncbi:hypothetical protein B5X24_HaOG205893 [Helicoverpa armigera]|uniref:Sialomucin core protein 24 n=1 Tax=Helicoverpa armigera TaxID=29058 RepID=A0A2W1BSB8_HELAM|nr:hypothetical protein B5X24_HaOG205893 [Helicoverpa armigera]